MRSILPSSAPRSRGAVLGVAAGAAVAQGDEQHPVGSNPIQPPLWLAYGWGSVSRTRSDAGIGAVRVVEVSAELAQITVAPSSPE